MNDYSETINNSAANATPMDRAAFIRKTYLHLAGCLLAFIVLEGLLFSSGAAYQMASVMFLGGNAGWFVVLGLFMGATYLADSWAISDTSKTTQYMGLGLYTLAEVVIFVPMLMIATRYGGSDVLVKSGVVSLGLFLGITSVVFLTKTDFSFLGPIITIGAFIALSLIVSAFLFGINLGTFFSLGMIALAGTSILYQTSKVMNKYRTDQYVAASLGLFGSIMLLFWYILRLFSGRR